MDPGNRVTVGGKSQYTPNSLLRGNMRGKKAKPAKKATAGYAPSVSDILRYCDFGEVMQTYVGWDTIVRYVQEIPTAPSRGKAWVLQLDSRKRKDSPGASDTWRLNTYAYDQKPFDVCYVNKVPELISRMFTFAKFMVVGDKFPHPEVPTIFIAKHRDEYRLWHFGCESLTEGQVLQLQEIIKAYNPSGRISL